MMLPWATTPADHELIFGVVAERVAHRTVPARDPDSIRNGSQQPLLLLLGDRAHRPDRHYQVEAVHLSLSQYTSSVSYTSTL
jgi:hypothetical protein